MLKSKPAGVYFPDPKSCICVEKFVSSAKKHKTPVLMTHGGGMTSASYITTPDGRPGWVNDFLQKGFDVYLMDWPNCGRSGNVSSVNGALVVNGMASVIDSIGCPVHLLVHSMSGAYAWKLGELLGDKLRSIIAIAPAPMGNIQSEPHVLKKDKKQITLSYLGREFDISLIQPFVYNQSWIDNKLIGINDTQFPRSAKDSLVSSLQSVSARLIYERLNVAVSQLRIKNFNKLQQVRVLVLTGTDDLDHPPELDRKIVDYLNKHNIEAEFLCLADEGVVGNGHLYMCAKNSSQIANIIVEWIKRNTIKGNY